MEWVSKTFKPSRSSHPCSSSNIIVPWSPSRASWLLVKEKDKLTEEDKQALERMKQADGKVAEAYDLGQRFAAMTRERRSEDLLPWLEDVAESGIGALKQFARGKARPGGGYQCSILTMEQWSDGRTGESSEAH